MTYITSAGVAVYILAGLSWDQLVFGLCALCIVRSRRKKVSVVFRPSTFQRFHDTLVRCKYRLLFGAKGRRKRSKGPEKELIEAVVAMKRQNPRFGCLKIAQEITHAFGLEINEDIIKDPSEALPSLVQ